jgi:fumarate reductase subunit D
MSTHPEDKPAVPVDTSLPVAPRTAERLVRHLKRAGSIVLVILFAVLMLALVLAIPVGYYGIKHQASLGQFSQFVCYVVTVTRSI